MDYRNFESDGLENTSKYHANHTRLTRFNQNSESNAVSNKLTSNFLLYKKKNF